MGWHIGFARRCEVPRYKSPNQPNRIFQIAHASQNRNQCLFTGLCHLLGVARYILRLAISHGALP
jgi:hypothetical protein